MPAVRILDNMQLEPNSYIIRVKEVEAGTGKVWPESWMAMDPEGGQVNLPGVHTVEPTFGLPATWVEADRREEASLRGYTVVDAATVLSTHLTEILKSNMPDLLSYAEVQKLLKELPKEQGELVKDLVPGQISVTGIQRVLQLLLNERVSIRDLGTVLEGIAEAVGATRNPQQIVEIVRVRLGRQLCAQHTSPNGYLPLIAMSPRWETAFAEAIVGERDERHLAMQPSSCRTSSPRCATASRKRRARANFRCCSPARWRGRSCARSSSASGRRPRSCRRPKFTPAPS